ncbi:MAG: hypothetical protein HYZ28_11335 [Myxococcales bacterium]|nr:hypothetical protein [Myxococcales bacterium]
MSYGRELCWIARDPLQDAGPALPGQMGGPCMDDSLCRGPPPDGFCETEWKLDGGLSGWPGGHCSAPCREEPSLCGDGGICAERHPLGWPHPPLCHAFCTPEDGGQSSCRPGYLCYPVKGSDGGAGFCLADCRNMGFQCPGGTCEDDGYCR